MEKSLIKTKKYNLDNQILNSVNEIIDRLLRRSDEMKPVHNELLDKLNETQIDNFWDAILGVAAYWNPDQSKSLRDDRKTLINLNKKIEMLANDLAKCIKKRKDIEHSGFESYEDYHLVHWVDRAGENNYHYNNYLKENLYNLMGRFDLKYWPSTHDIIELIALYAKDSEVITTDQWTAELLVSPKCSMSDYLRVMLKAINDKKNHGQSLYLLPQEFKVTDRSLATLINCTLNLESENIITTEYIKSTRQNIRKSIKQKKFNLRLKIQ